MSNFSIFQQNNARHRKAESNIQQSPDMFSGSYRIRLTVLFISFLFSHAALFSQSTQGDLTFSVRTITYGGDHSPKHVLAIWVEDQNGFVLTRELNGDRRKQWLLTWNSSSGGNTVDATTGATLSSHTTHTVNWDSRDFNGNLVPDGQYILKVEFTEEHAQGPLMEIPFTKSNQQLSLNPPDETYFKDMSLTYEPLAVQAGFSYIADGLSVSFTNTSTGAETYSWAFGDGNGSTESNPMYTYPTGGNYIVTLTAVGQVTTAISQSINVSAPSTGIYHPNIEDFSISYLRNGNILLKLSGDADDIRIELYSINGTVLPVPVSNDRNQAVIGMSQLPVGLYLLRIDHGDKHTGRVVVRSW